MAVNDDVKNVELLDCPFCGGSAKMRAWSQWGDSFFKAYCVKCGASTNEYLGPADAEEAWNSRA